MEPLISVIMPAYNSEYTIERAIESVLAQTYTRFELLVIDDYSMQRLSKDMSSTKPLPMKTMHCGLTCHENFWRLLLNQIFINRIDPAMDFLPCHVFSRNL